MNDDQASSETNTSPPTDDDQVDPSPPESELTHLLLRMIGTAPTVGLDAIPSENNGISFFGFNVIIGDNVAGNKFTTATCAKTRPVDLAQLPEVVLRKVREVFVPPSVYERARKVLDDNNVVAPASTTHDGKWTAAVHLLVNTGLGVVVDLQQPDTLGQLLHYPFARDVGYVLRWTDDLDLTEVDFMRLSQVLGRCGSRLILVTTNAPDVGDGVIPWHPPADSARVLERHLRFYTTGQPSFGKAAQLLGHADVVAMRSGQRTLREIDALSRLLAKVVSGDLSLKEAIEQDDERARDEVISWFTEHRSRQRRCVLRIATSVLRGLRYQTVVDAADRLAELSGTPEETTDGPFGATRDEELKDIRAYVRAERKVAHYGPAAVEVVDMTSTAQAVAVLNHAWSTYQRLRGPLTTWLDELARHGDQDLGVCAATAAGMLGRHDFGHVQEHLIGRWARDRDSRLRLLAASALGVLARFPDSVGQARALVHHWISQRTNRRLTWTAVAAYTTDLGLVAVDTALRDLIGLASRTTTHAGRATVTWGVGAVFDTGAVIPENYGKTLVALRDAVPAQVRREPVAAACPLHVFLSLTRRRSAPPGIPVLLELYGAAAPVATDIVALWRAALDCRPTRGTAQDHLREWVEIVDQAPERIGVIKDLLRELCAGAFPGDTRPSKRVQLALRLWGRDQNRPSPAANQLWQELFDTKVR